MIQGGTGHTGMDTTCEDQLASLFREAEGRRACRFTQTGGGQCLREAVRESGPSHSSDHGCSGCSAARSDVCLSGKHSDGDAEAGMPDCRSVTKSGETDPVFWFQNGVANGDHRFKPPSLNDPSLLLTDTAVSDEGRYDYTVLTNRGIKKEAFRINVTAKYNPPSVSRWPEKIEEGSPAELYCNASGGYPAGTIHWFDRTKTNWTKNATLEITEREDQLLHLSSKLTFAKINSSWAPFKCVVLNSKFDEDEESTSHLTLTGDGTGFIGGSVIAGLLVIGLIIVGLLLALLYRRRHVQQARRPSAQPILRDFSGSTRQAGADADADIEADELQIIR
ncbi:hypothetical protein SRHO_G00335370 [Serrasalmus rhombeus]